MPRFSGGTDGIVAGGNDRSGVSGAISRGGGRDRRPRLDTGGILRFETF